MPGASVNTVRKSNVKGEKFPTTAVGSIAKVIFSIVPPPTIPPGGTAPETETNKVPGVVTLQVGLRLAAAEIVPAVEQPAFAPDGSITAGS
jgi:hypothetical protein